MFDQAPPRKRTTAICFLTSAWRRSPLNHRPIILRLLLLLFTRLSRSAGSRGQRSPSGSLVLSHSETRASAKQSAASCRLAPQKKPSQCSFQSFLPRASSGNGIELREARTRSSSIALHSWSNLPDMSRITSRSSLPTIKCFLGF